MESGSILDVLIGLLFVDKARAGWDADTADEPERAEPERRRLGRGVSGSVEQSDRWRLAPV